MSRTWHRSDQSHTRQVTDAAPVASHLSSYLLSLPLALASLSLALDLSLALALAPPLSRE